MDFSLTEIQQNLREMAHWLAEHKIRPLSLAADRDHRWPDDFLLELHQMGVSGGGAMARMEEKSKPSQANRTAAIAVEEMAWGDASLILSLPGPGLGGPPVDEAACNAVLEQLHHRGPDGRHARLFDDARVSAFHAQVVQETAPDDDRSDLWVVAPMTYAPATTSARYASSPTQVRRARSTSNAG